MDFFASQDAAHRSSRLLLLLFVVAIASIMALANLTVYLIVKFQTIGMYEFDLELALQICGAVLVLIILGSLYRIHSLKSGGEAIALSLGGKLIVDGGTNEHERRLINVVEEMAIASGLPVPAVYLLEEDGINAFAAGYGSGDAVIGVTKGAMLNLSRDQLQGVVAHEFSHVLNGDMRLNIRLVGILHGILMLSIVGRVMLEARPGVGRKTTGAFPVLFLGLSLFLIGYIGKFFGDLIKAGVSRQREYLADASAVQFTRNPDGIGGALKRIGGHVAGSNVHHAGAGEFSHLYFSAAGRSFASMLATHPPLETRITRIEPTWDGEYLNALPVTDVTSDVSSGFAGGSGQVTQQEILQSVENPQPANLETAQQILTGIPLGLKRAVNETYSVRAVIYLMFLNGDESKRAAQLEVINQHADVFVRSRLKDLLEETPHVPPESRLPLLELAMPALRRMTQSEYERLSNNLKLIQKAAQPLTLSDWALVYYIQHHLSEAFGSAKRVAGSKSLQSTGKEIAYLLSMLAYSDRDAQISPGEAFNAGCELIDLPLEMTDKSGVSIKKLEQAIHSIAQVRPLQKPRVLKSFVAVICADDKVSPVEAELVRCIADAVDCPLPPLQGSQNLV